MMKIQFKNVCPHIFEDLSLKSDVWNNDFIIQDGMRYQLRGSSGRGKTSFLSYLLGHRKDYNGEVFINDRAVLDINIDEWVELRREKISSVFQDLQLIEKISVADNIALVPKFANGHGLSKAKNMLGDLGMADKWEAQVETLSFGQKQRVAIVRALCKPFDLLICDEPFSHLDTMHKAKCVDLIESRLTEENAGILLTSLDGENQLDLKSIHL